MKATIRVDNGQVVETTPLVVSSAIPVGGDSDKEGQHNIISSSSDESIIEDILDTLKLGVPIAISYLSWVGVSEESMQWGLDLQVRQDNERLTQIPVLLSLICRKRPPIPPYSVMCRNKHLRLRHFRISGRWPHKSSSVGESFVSLWVEQSAQVRRKKSMYFPIFLLVVSYGKALVHMKAIPNSVASTCRSPIPSSLFWAFLSLWHGTWLKQCGYGLEATQKYAD